MSLTPFEQTAIIQNQPTNVNPITNTHFRVSIKDLKNTPWFAQSFNIPSLEIPIAIQKTPTLSVPRPGTGIKFNQLTIDLLIDENFDNYFEIFNWIYQIAEPQGATENYYPVKDKDVFKTILIEILDNKDNPKFNLLFYNCFPVSISDVKMDTKQTGIKYLVASVTFAFTIFLKE